MVYLKQTIMIDYTDMNDVHDQIGANIKERIRNGDAVKSFGSMIDNEEFLHFIKEEMDT